jgi:hypothetical protein
MIRNVILAAASVAAVWLAGEASAADPRAPKGAAVVAAAPVVGPVQDCSAFYARYGFQWGSGPGTSVGLGTFEGALPRYVPNSFPNWYGECVNWGHYSATGVAVW